MGLVKKIENKGAVTAWSPIEEHRQLLAVGVKDTGVGGGFDDQGGNLEIHLLDFQSPTDRTTIIGNINAGGRFVSIAWSPMTKKKERYPYGIIVGGMTDGSLAIWDPARIIQEHQQPLLSSLHTHTGPVNSIMFNTHPGSVHLLASGGADGDAYVINLDNPENPTKFPVPGSQGQSNANYKPEITKVAWNSKVPHILATASAGGNCSVWDLKQKRQYCELRDPSKAVTSDIAWHPNDGLLIMTASGNDAQPSISLWDLRSSISLPFATLKGHTEGVLSISWSSHDPTFLVSCGKDNRTIVWDLMKMEPCYELPIETPPETNTGGVRGVDAFGGFAGAGLGQNRRYAITWSPLLRSVLSASNFNRTVEVFSLLGFKSSTGRCPKWLLTSGRVQWAFGGKLLSIQRQTTEKEGNVPQKSQIVVNKFVQDKELVAVAQKFERDMSALVSNETIKEYISYKISTTESSYEKQTWTFMNLIFDSSGNEALFKELGLEIDSETKTNVSNVPPPMPQVPTSGGGNQNAHDFFDAPPPTSNDETIASKPLSSPSGNLSERSGKMDPLSIVSADTYPEASGKIRRCLLAGNFEGAVDICLEYDLIGEAFFLAKHGGDELWQTTTEKFVSKEKSKRPLLHLLDAVIKSDMSQLIVSSDLSQWKETLALISTYSKSNEFPSLCEELASRLENERLDRAAAATCYMCSHNLEKVVEVWKDDVESKPENLVSLALQAFVEKVSMMMLAKRQEALPEGTAKELFMKYGLALASQGEVELAMKYISKAVSGSNQSAAILLDRLYHSSIALQKSFPKPPSPFKEEKVNIQSYQPNVSGNNIRTSSTASDDLPPDWIELLDNNTNRKYYANVKTKETQWERPAMPIASQTPIPAPSKVNTFNTLNTQPISSINSKPSNSFMPTSSLTMTNKVGTELKSNASSIQNTSKTNNYSGSAFVPSVSKYNDSFISTVGNPTLGSQYGNHYGNNLNTMGGPNNIGSQPMSNGGLSYGSGNMNQLPNQEQTQPQPEPVVEKPPPEPPKELPEIQEGFSSITTYLHGNERLTGSDRKQLEEIEKALSVLYGKLNIMDVDPAIPPSVLQFVQAILASDLSTAQRIHQKFVKDHWDTEKVWIKPVKDILRLVKK